MATKFELEQKRALHLLIVHNYIHRNQNVGATQIREQLDLGTFTIRERLKELCDRGLVKAFGAEGRGGRGRRYTSIVKPAELIEYTAVTKKQSTPPSLLLSKLWTPEHLKLSA